MLNKKIMMLAILLVSLLAISAVSAADNTTSDIVSAEETTSDAISVNEADEVISAEDNQVILEENNNVGNFTELFNLIKSTPEGTALILTKDYKYVDGSNEGIIINRAITIDGKGHTLDGNNLSRIFSIESSNVFLKNIAFKNGLSDSPGGAISVIGDNCEIIKCNFTNNVARTGGAIYADGENCSVISSSFTNSVANRYGGAVYGFENIVNCTFVNSNSVEDGGAIGATKNVINCSFLNSMAKHGGAIYNRYATMIKNCIFINSIADTEKDSIRGYGGAINIGSMTSKIINCTFIKSSNNRFHGGVIFTRDTDCEIIDCNFKDISTPSGSGGIYMIDTNCKIIRSNFINIAAYGLGAAICSAESNRISVINCSFINTSSSDSAGGAIYLGYSDCEIINCTFENCRSDDDGNAIYSDINNCTIENCNFTNCHDPWDRHACICEASPINMHNIRIDGIKYDLIFEDVKDYSHVNLTKKYTLAFNHLLRANNVIIDGRGNIVNGQEYFGLKIEGDNVTIKNLIFNQTFIKILGKNCTILNCSFIECYTSRGGAINIHSSFNNIKGCNFTDCNSYNGGAIYMDNSYPHISSNIIECCSFNNCHVVINGWVVITGATTSGYGGAIYLTGTNNIIRNNTFIKCYTPNTVYAFCQGGAIYENGINTVITNNTFVDCFARNGGSGIYSAGADCRLTDSSFYGCQWDDENNLHISNIKLNGIKYVPLEDSVKNSIIDMSKVSQLCLLEPINRNNIFIKGNGNVIESAENMLGGLKIYGSNVTIENLIFKDAYIIINSSASNCTIVNCSFLSSGINSLNPIMSSGVNCNIADCNFINCTIQENGVVYENGADCTIFNCSFINCYSERYGGTVCSYGLNCHVVNCSFIKCSSYYGVLYSKGDNFLISDCNLIGCSFWSNDGYGGIVYSCRYNCAIINSAFINCTGAPSSRYVEGIAVHSSRDYCNIRGCSFINCSSDFYPVLALFGKQNTLMNCTFSKGGFLWNGLKWCSNDVNVSDIRYLKLDSSVTISDRTFEAGTISISTNLYTAIGVEAYVVNKPDADISTHDNLIQIVNLEPGNYTLCVTTVTNDDYNPVTKYFDIVVTKKHPTLSVKTQNVQYGESAVITVNLNVEGADVTLELNKQKYTQSISNGKAIFEISNLTAGTYDINVTFAGDAYYVPTSSSDVFSITKKSITTYSISRKITSDRNLTVTIPSDATGIIEITIKIDSVDTIFNSSIVNGVASFNISNLSNGQYEYNLKYYGDENYKSFKSTSKTFTIDRPVIGTIIPEITIPPLDKPSSDGYIKITLPSDATGKVTLTIDGEDYTYYVEDGEVNIIIPDLDGGDYPYTITYSGDSKYSSFVTNGNMKVNNTKPEDVKPTPEVVIPPLDEPSEDGSVAISLPGDATGTVTLTINGKEYSFPVVNGVANVYMPDLSAKTYSYSITYSGDSKYDSFTNTGSLTVTKKPVNIAASSVTTVYNGGKYIVVTLTDKDNNPMSDFDVTLTINDKPSVITTDDNGQAKFSVKGIKPGTYVPTVVFSGNSKYLSATKSLKVTVKKATPKLTAAKKTFKRTLKTKKYTITLKTNQNKVMKNTKVTLKVNGKTYSAKTNTKGQATFKITKLTKKGKFTATIKYAGSKYYNAKTVKAKITVK